MPCILLCAILGWIQGVLQFYITSCTLPKTSIYNYYLCPSTDAVYRFSTFHPYDIDDQRIISLIAEHGNPNFLEVEFPLPRPRIAPGDRRVSPSLRTFSAGLLLSQWRGSDQDIPLQAGRAPGSSEEAPGSVAKRGRGADERQRTPVQEVGGRGPPRNERERVVEALAGGGRRVSKRRAIFLRNRSTV